MNLKFIYSVAAMALALALTGCNALHSKSMAQSQTPTPSPSAYPDGVRRVTIEEMEALVKENKAVVIDVRGQDAYDAGHIPGAKVIASADILNHVNELPKDKLIITYCS